MHLKIKLAPPLPYSKGDAVHLKIKLAPPPLSKGDAVHLKSGHSEILIMSFVSIGALYCMFSKKNKKGFREISDPNL